MRTRQWLRNLLDVLSGGGAEEPPVWEIVMPEAHGRGIDQWETAWQGRRWTLMTWNPDDCQNEESRAEIGEHELLLSVEATVEDRTWKPWLTVSQWRYVAGDDLRADRDAILTDLPGFLRREQIAPQTEIKPPKGRRR